MDGTRVNTNPIAEIIFNIVFKTILSCNLFPSQVFFKWSDGILERWNVGVMDYSLTIRFHYFITPAIHHSTKYHHSSNRADG